MNKPLRSVLIVQEHLPHYRIPLFQQLREKLGQHGITLRLVFSQKSSQSHLPGVLPWAEPLPIHWIGRLGWQNLLPLARGVSLVITPQETKYAAIPFLLFLRNWGGWKFAFWGHGKNFQAVNPNSLAERWKRLLSRRCDWWFAYNSLSAQVVKDLGFPSCQITDLGNTIDTHSLMSLRNKVSASQQQSLRHSLGIQGGNVAIFTGRLYEQKRVPFLLAACRQVRQRLPDFELLVVGSGPQEALLRDAAHQDPWIHFLGPKNDQEKVPYWSLAKVALMPGLVGLGVMDSFSMGVPLITTDYPYHSPEISYLKHGENGWISRPWQDSGLYADAVVNLLQNPALLRSLAQEGILEAEKLTIESMCHRFCEGILLCLKQLN